VYCALSDILSAASEVEIARLTDDESGRTINEDVVNTAISKGDELINGYLRSRYDVPLSSPPLLIRNISVDLALYYLNQRRYRTNMPESVENQYKATVKILEQIQKGFVNLGIEPQADEGGQVGIYRTNKTSSDKLFNKELLDKF
jgi:phage gp36-like protein